MKRFRVTFSLDFFSRLNVFPKRFFCPQVNITNQKNGRRRKKEKKIVCFELLLSVKCVHCVNLAWRPRIILFFFYFVDFVTLYHVFSTFSLFSSFLCFMKFILYAYLFIFFFYGKGQPQTCILNRLHVFHLFFFFLLWCTAKMFFFFLLFCDGFFFSSASYCFCCSLIKV